MSLTQCLSWRCEARIYNMWEESTEGIFPGESRLMLKTQKYKNAVDEHNLLGIKKQTFAV